MSATTKLITGEELLAMGDIGPCELIYGRIVRLSLSGFEHGQVCMQVLSLLADWNDERRLGVLVGAGCGFQLERNPDLVRAPDVAYVQANRVGDEVPTGYFDGAPDLAVEVISPSDTWPEVTEKVDMWLAHGCQSCWIVDPRNQQVSIHRIDGTIVKLKSSDEIQDPILPGFRATVADVFAI